MGKNVRNILLSLVVVFIFLVLAVGSAEDDDEAEPEPEEPVEEEEKVEEEPDPEVAEEDKINVDFDYTIDIDDESVSISGTTNLIDGAVIDYEVENFDNIDDFIEGQIEVQDGEFHEQIDTSGFSDGEISAWIAFYPFTQPENIQAEYGEMGEYLKGDVEYSSGMEANIIVAEKTYIKETPIEISGAGDTATDDFYLRSGFAVLEFYHTGASNIIVELLDETATSVELMINEIGEYQGKTLALIPESGEYLLDIDADGSWEAKITQSPDETHTTPLAYEGQGDDVFFIELEAGRKDFEFSHQGDSNFIVMVNKQLLLVNEIGDYQGSTVENIPDPGTYPISVEADGSWYVNIE